MAKPVYTAPGVVASMVALAPPAHPEIVPFRFAKMNRDDVVALPGVSWKDAVLVLLTCPVGPCGPPAVVGIATNPLGAMLTRVTLVLPVMLYSVEVLDPWLETQNGLVALREMPHGFTSNGSVIVARPGMLDTRFVWRYGAGCAPAAPAATTITDRARACKALDRM